MARNGKSEDDMKKEIEELKKRNDEMAKMVKAVYDRLAKVNGGSDNYEEYEEDMQPSPKAEKMLNNDLKNVRKKRVVSSHPKHRVSKSTKPARPAKPAKPARPPRPPAHTIPSKAERERARREIEKQRREIEKQRREIEKQRKLARIEREKVRREARRAAAEELKEKSIKIKSLGDLEKLGDTFDKYLESVVSGVTTNLGQTLRTAVSGAKKAVKTLRIDDDADIYITPSKLAPRISDEEFEEFIEKASMLLSAIGDKNRLTILKLLEIQPEYQKELSEKTGLRGGTFKHHTDTLQEAGFITQEAVRGRYLITQLGIEALKLAEVLYYRRFKSEEDVQRTLIISTDDADDTDIDIDIDIDIE